ncbi:MAG: polysaccharide biosynthesis protein [Erysipelotrichales bacterium]|nr:polysaccharide biosynthesis protein [Erysipelotrichales bacterium]
MKKNSFVEGTIIATVAIVIVKILGMLYVIPFYKIVGSNGGALYSYAYNIYLIFLGISSAGLPDAIAKIISEYNTLGMDDAKNRAYKIARQIISFISIFAFILLFIFAEEIGKFIIGDLDGVNTAKDIAFVVRCVSPAVLLIPFLSITKGYLQGHKYIGPSSMSQLLEQIVRILVILLGSYLVLKVFEGTLSLAIGIAVSGAFFGGLVAYIYLRKAIVKGNLKQKEENKKDEITNKEITRKIIKYAIPFVIISIVSHLYNFTDQILVLRTLEGMGFAGEDVEFIASSISTWSPKICMIINSMAMGMTMSLVPTIVSAITEKNYREVENKINKSLSMIVFISLPLSLGLCVLQKSVWTIFYDVNPYGPDILGLMVFSALFGNLYLIVSTICQSLNKFKLVYLVSITGFLLNAALDVPIMYLFKIIGFKPFLGSITASIIGYSVSVFIGLFVLKRENNIKYKDTVKTVGRTLIPGLFMALVLLTVNSFLKLNELTISGAILTIIIDAIIGGIIYISISYKMGLIDYIIGKDMLNNILKKLTLGKLKLKN